jgi:CRP/FNR family transcriptional regulator, cyclic AMP receptor protein
MGDISPRSSLERLAFTGGLDPSQLDRLAEIAAPVSWDAGTTVFREGDRGTHLFLVEEGHVAIEIPVPGRGRTTILTVGPGEVFGWSSLFGDRPKTAAARAVEATSALALDAVRLSAMCEADPGLGYALTRRILAVVSERLKATRMQLLDVFGG